MYNGQTRFFGTSRRIVVNRRTGELGSLGGDDELDEVKVTVQRVPDVSETDPTRYGRQVPNSPYKPTEYDDMQVIEVSGTRIPWWVWGVGGLLGASVLFKLSKGR